jgi:tRNA threonylcarbamoyl adenosine modification protein YeaZ
MITLALDTSTPRGSVALLRDDSVLAETAFTRDRSGDQLFPTITTQLSQHKLTGSDISRIVVGTGPGSFTGIRAGIAAAKGLALPRNTSVVGVPSYDAIALAAADCIPKDCVEICVIGDARRDEIYFAVYNRSGRNTQPCRIGSLETLPDLIHNPIWFISSEIEMFADDLKTLMGGFAVVDTESRFPSASTIGILAQQSSAPPEPIYLREPQYTKTQP